MANHEKVNNEYKNLQLDGVPFCFKNKLIKGYLLTWVSSPSEESFGRENWILPEDMIEQVLDSTEQGITFIFPTPITQEEFKKRVGVNYEPENGDEIIWA